jgi:hypothetical protein
MSTDPINLFRASWSDAHRYPLNLLKFGSNVGALRVHRDLLKENAPNLFQPKSKVIVLEFSKQNPTTGTTHVNKQIQHGLIFAVTPMEIKTDLELRSWLQVPAPNLVSNTPVSNVRCRIM